MIVKGKLKTSASALKTYEKCNREYYYRYIEKPTIEKKDWPHLRIGNFAHAVLDDFHKTLNVSPTQDWKTLMTDLCKAKVDSFKLKPEEKKIVKDMLAGYLIKLHQDGLPVVVATEEGFSIALDEDTTIKGVIDRIDDETGEDGIPKYHIKDYKGLALDTMIPTPNGWSTMKDLAVGGYVFGSSGSATKITAKSKIHNRPCYRISFLDKTEVICDNVHIWPVNIVTKTGSKNHSEILNTDELYNLINDNATVAIPNPQPLIFETADLPIHPWVLGAWLGDGHSKTGSLTVGEDDFDDMRRLIKNAWGDISYYAEKPKNNNCKKVSTITLGRPRSDHCTYSHNLNENTVVYKSGKKCKICVDIANQPVIESNSDHFRGNVVLRNRLDNNNLLLNKHIPKQYFTSSIEQRISLLQGLMDTDGHWNKLRKQCVFVTSKRDFSEQVLELIRGLGITATCFDVTDKKGFESFQITFCPTNFTPFLLPRKAELYNMETFSKTKKFNSGNRFIKSVEKIASVPTQCIAVDAEDRLYVCGKGMCLSHNTGKSEYLDEFQLLVYGLYLLDRDPTLERFRGSYTMLAEGSRSHMTSVFTRTDLERVSTKIKKVADEIRNDKAWEPKPQFLCKYCDYNQICPSSPFKSADGGRKEW